MAEGSFNNLRESGLNMDKANNKKKIKKPTPSKLIKNSATSCCFGMIRGQLSLIYLILMISMPVTVRLTWSPAAAQSRGSSCSVIPAGQSVRTNVTTGWQCLLVIIRNV